MLNLGLGLGITRGRAAGPAIGDYTANGFTPDMALVPQDGFYYSAGPANFDTITGGTFARASDATFTDSTGTLDTAGANVARVSHYLSDGSGGFSKAGMLDGDEAANLDDDSEVFAANWTAQNITPTDDAVTGPDGLPSAATLIPTTGNATHNLLKSYNVTASTMHTYSLFAEDAGYDFLIFRIDDGGANGVKVAYDVNTGVISTAAATNGTGFTLVDAGIERVGGFYRVFITFIRNAGTFLRAIPYVSNVTGDGFSTPAFAGDGVSGINFFGSDLKEGVLSSYVKTTGSTVARASDDLRIPAAVMQAAILAATGSSAMPAAISSSMHLLLTYADLGTAGQSTIYDRRVDVNNRITVTMDTDGAKTGTFTLTMVNGGASATVSSAVEITPGVNVTANLSWSMDAAGIGLSLNGTDATQATAIGVPDLTTADVEYLSANAVAINAQDLEWFDQIGSAGRIEANS